MVSKELTGLILAAGRGSRLQSMTDHQPKGLVKLNGRCLVEWQIETLEAAGIGTIKIVNGYLGHMYDKFDCETITNKIWDKTNMVGSLMCAIDELDGPFLISYSDIVYHPSIVQGLIAKAGDFVISYDKNWFDLWSERFEDPLTDAESFRIDEEGRIIEIGKKASSIEQIEGQFMGLIKVSREGINWIKELVEEDDERRFLLDTTAMINLLIEKGRTITGFEIMGNWCEVDDQNDLKVAEARLLSGKLSLISMKGE